jgi:predicted permease
VKQLYDDLLSEIRALPGVEAAGYAIGVVLSGGWDQLTVNVEGYTPRDDENMSPYANTVSPGYFDVLRLPLIAGRDFSARDNLQAPKVTIINETMARYFFGNSNPLGKKVGLSPEKPPDMEIIGVVKDAKYVSVREEPVRHFYLPMGQQENLFDMTLHVRTRAESQDIVAQIRRRAHELDPNVPLYNVKKLETTVDESLTQDRLVTWLSGGLAILATLLAALGLYGVIAFSVTRRTREIGIRMALGAKRQDVLSLVVKQVTGLVILGLAGGLLLAWSGSRFVQAILYEVRSTDPAAFLGATLMFLFAAVAAAFFPARKAVRVEPSTALRYE